MDSDKRAAFTRRELANRLSAHFGDWRVEDDQVRNAGRQAVALREHGGARTPHLDFGFVLNRDRRDLPIIWDCAAGIGETEEDSLRWAVETWCSFTAVVMIEFLTRRSKYADHYSGTRPGGLAGWHVIHGPVLTFGYDDGPDVLQRWVLDHPLLPQLREPIIAALDRPMLNGLKLFLGGDEAEVRINGRVDPAASAALCSLDWPRLDPPSFARSFVLAVQPDTTAEPNA